MGFPGSIKIMLALGAFYLAQCLMVVDPSMIDGDWFVMQHLLIFGGLDGDWGWFLSYIVPLSAGLAVCNNPNPHHAILGVPIGEFQYRQ